MAKGDPKQVGANTKENPLTTSSHSKHKIWAEEFEASGALLVTVATTNFKHSSFPNQINKTLH